MAIQQDFRVKRGLFVSEQATVSGNTSIGGNTAISGLLTVGSTTTINGATTIASTANVYNTATVGSLVSQGSSQLNSTLTVVGAAALSNTLTVSGSTTIYNDLTVSGNLVVSGAMTYVNTSILNISDNMITLNADWTTAASENVGIEVNRGTDTKTYLFWNEVVDQWQVQLPSGATHQLHYGTTGGSSLTYPGNSGGSVIQNIGLTIDAYGHVTSTAYSSVNLDNRYLSFQYIAASGQSTIAADAYNDTLTVANGGAMVITTDATNDILYVSHADTSNQGNLSVDNSNGTVLQDIFLNFDTYGHVTYAAVNSFDGDGRWVKKTGDTMSGRLIVPQGATGGIAFPDNAYGGTGDTASITLQNPSGSEATRMTFTMSNDVDDLFSFVAPSNSGMLMNGNVVWNAGNQGHSSGLNADMVDGYHLSDLDSRYGTTAFTNIAVSGQSTVVADSNADTVTFVGAGGISITTDATNDIVYFNAPSRTLPVRADSVNMDFYYSGQSGQPSWLWGTNDGTNMYVWNPSNFSVNYATYANKLTPISGTASYKLGYTADGQRTNAGDWGRVVMVYDGNGQTYGVRVDRADYADSAGSATNATNASYATSAGSASSATNANYAASAGTVTIGYNNDSNSTYQMLWGSGTSVYGTGGIYCNPSSDIIYAAAFYDANNTGYYCDPHGSSRFNTIYADYARSFGDFQADGAVYSPGFYDLNNSGYYCDPSSTSSFNALNILSAAPTLWLYDSDGLDFAFYVNGDVWNLLNNSSTSIFSITQAGAVTASNDITAFSDARIKKDIQTFDHALDTVDQLRGVRFARRDTEQQSVGVIAQEVQQVLPEVVHENQDGMLSVAYGNMVGVLIEAIKELRQEVNQLKDQLAAK